MLIKVAEKTENDVSFAPCHECPRAADVDDWSVLSGISMLWYNSGKY